MQHLTQRIEELLVIRDYVEIMVVKVDGDTVKIAISAPSGVRIYESEV